MVLQWYQEFEIVWQIAIDFAYSYFIDCKRLWRPQKRGFYTAYQIGESKILDLGLIKHLEQDYFEIGCPFGK